VLSQPEATRRASSADDLADAADKDRRTRQERCGAVPKPVGDAEARRGGATFGEANDIRTACKSRADRGVAPKDSANGALAKVSLAGFVRANDQERSRARSGGHTAAYIAIRAPQCGRRGPESLNGESPQLSRDRQPWGLRRTSNAGSPELRRVRDVPQHMRAMREDQRLKPARTTRRCGRRLRRALLSSPVGIAGQAAPNFLRSCDGRRGRTSRRVFDEGQICV